MFKEAIKNLLIIINDLIKFTIMNNDLDKNLNSFNNDLFDQVITIMNGSVKVVALSLLSLFALLEFIKITSKTENNGLMSVELITRALVKIAICKVFLDKSKDIIGAIYEISLYIIKTISTDTFSNDVLDLALLNVAVENSELGDQIFALLIGVIVLIVLVIVVLLVQLIVIGRFIELYILLAVAPIPIATICSDEHSQIAKSFLKNVMAVGLQGVIIIIGLSFLPTLLNASLFTLSSPGATTNITIELFKILGYSILIAIVIFTSQSLAKKAINAM